LLNVAEEYRMRAVPPRRGFLAAVRKTIVFLLLNRTRLTVFTQAE